MTMFRKRAVVLVCLLMAGGAAITAAQNSAPVGAKSGGQTQTTPSDAKTPAPEPNTVSVELAGAVPPEDRKNLKEYWPAVESRTKQQWLMVLPAEARPPVSRPGTVIIEGMVHTDGRVTGMALKQPSGRPALDRAAWAAITRSMPYAAFPYGIAADEAKVRFTFVYNQGAATPVGGPSASPIH
jgi:TonB family protein